MSTPPAKPDHESNTEKLTELLAVKDARIEELERELASVKSRVLDMRDYYPQEVEEFMSLTRDQYSDPELRQAVEDDWKREGWR